LLVQLLEPLGDLSDFSSGPLVDRTFSVNRRKAKISVRKQFDVFANQAEGSNETTINERYDYQQGCQKQRQFHPVQDVGAKLKR
jgi:hypothetical protein